MKRRILSIILAFSALSCTQTPYFEGAFGVEPIYPDYIGVTVPSTIAPLNFVYTIDGAQKAVTTFTCGNQSVTFKGREVEWKEKQWRKLLAEVPEGGDISVSSSVLDSVWTIHVSPDPIDYGITYRLISPGYETFSYIGIYERNLSTFKETPLLEDTQFDGCVNCHSFNQCDPGDLSLHIRGIHGTTIIRKDGKMGSYNTKTDQTLGFCVYPYWHPSGNYIAYSTNTTKQCFHVRSGNILEVYDINSDLQIYDVRNNCLITAPSIKQEKQWENYPVFSADGRTLYFVSCPERLIPAEIEQLKYNLYKVSFDPETGTIGDDVQLVLDVASQGKNIAFPRPSFDGKYILYSLFDFSGFPCWHKEADLWLLDLATGETKPLTNANSPDAESFHSWSSNSRWIVFGSRRDDGLFTRAYICHIDENGECDKPFMLPQEHPLHYYAVQSRSFNVPEFVTGPVNFDRREAQKIINSPDRIPFGFRWSD